MEVKLSIHTVNYVGVCVCVCVYVYIDTHGSPVNIKTQTYLNLIGCNATVLPPVFLPSSILQTLCAFIPSRKSLVFHYSNCTSLKLHKLGSVCNRDAAFHVYHQLRALALVEECEV